VAVRIAVVLSPVADAAAVIEAARAADEAGLDAVGLWDHYHSARPDWAYVSGWSVYGAIAAMTTNVHLVPMVLNNLHYEPGVLAKESSILSLASGGRFELGIGAGDWPESFAAWGRPFPPRDDRVARLAETVEALRLVWTGLPTTYRGRHVELHDAICTPAPVAPPRVVIGVGKSRLLLERVASFADEVNVYDDAPIVDAAFRVRAEGGPAVSVFATWEWDKWPADAAGAVRSFAQRGFDRLFVSIGGADMPARVAQLAQSLVTI
jgi:alkanesulfonate monooxygenase SsuD/methylene tetrahydromethanopterin reductase-like flavin-dependent oxidoreductase (luciferase family)